MQTRTNKMTAFSILSLSLLTMTPGAVSATVPGIIKAFPGTSQQLAESTITATSFTMALFILISSVLVKKIGTKKVVLAGLALVACSTILAILAPNVTVLYYSRILLGAGIGLFNALCVSLLGYFYTGREREKLLGFQNTFQGLGAAGGSLLVALILMVANWWVAYIIYLISFVIFLFYLRFVPEVRYDQPTSTDAKAKEPDAHLSVGNILNFSYYWIVLFLMMIFYVTVTVKITTYILKNHFGSLSIGSSAVVIMSIGTIIAGTCYGKLHDYFGHGTLILAIVIEVLGAALLAFAHNALACTVGALLVGTSFGFFIPFVFSIGLAFVPKKYGNDATTIMMMSTNAATFSCPYFDHLLAGGLSNRHLFTMFTWVLLVIGIIETVKFWQNHRQRLTH